MNAANRPDITKLAAEVFFPPTPAHRTLYAASSESHARAIAQDLGLRGAASRFRSADGSEMVSWPAQGMQGFRFDTIIVSESIHRDAYHASPTKRDNIERWLKDLQCRLAPGGRMITV